MNYSSSSMWYTWFVLYFIWPPSQQCTIAVISPISFYFVLESMCMSRREREWERNEKIEVQNVSSQSLLEGRVYWRSPMGCTDGKTNAHDAEGALSGPVNYDCPANEKLRTGQRGQKLVPEVWMVTPREPPHKLCIVGAHLQEQVGAAGMQQLHRGARPWTPAWALTWLLFDLEDSSSLGLNFLTCKRKLD